MKKVLITGANGFIGKNLRAHLKAAGSCEVLPFSRQSDPKLLEEYGGTCDFVFHLAGVNRPERESDFEENHLFTRRLLLALEKGKNPPTVLFSSSVQAELETPYGKSKRKAEALVFEYSRETGADALVFRLPNVFGKWCVPDYNSVVATFCHHIARGLPVRIDNPDIPLSLVYIDDVLRAFIAALDGKAVRQDGFCGVEPVYHIMVGKLADLIESFQRGRKRLLLPDLSDPLTRRLYSTFLSYLPPDSFSQELPFHRDRRGAFVECMKSAAGEQISVNVVKPGTTKGGHWHHTKTETFVAASGSGIMRFQKPDGSGEVLTYPISAEKPEAVCVPPGYVHDITNTGDGDLVTLTWTNQIYDPQNPDTYPEKIQVFPNEED